MTSPQHHSNHHHHSNPCCCCCCCCSNSSSPSPPPLTTSDQLLQLLASHLLLRQPPPPHQLDPHQYLKSPNPHQAHHHKEQQQHYPQQQTQSLLHSLLRRVAALESSLPHFSSSSHPPPSSSPSPPPPPPPPPRTPPPRPPPSLPVSLRDLAAQTIQARFRRFLVRRSQTLRHLKRLAAIKSYAADLKSSLSDRTHLTPKALSQRAMDLLLELDSIQSGDPMIREGRRSISRELVRILEFIDKVLAREQQLSLGAMEIAAYNSKGRAFQDDGVPISKPAKKVSFAEDGEESTISVGAHEPFLEEVIDGDIAGDGRVAVQRLIRELKDVGGFSRVFEEDGEEAHLGPEGWKVSDDENSPKGVAETGVRYGKFGQFQGQNGNLGLYAPLPVQMEARRGDSKKKLLIPPY